MERQSNRTQDRTSKVFHRGLIARLPKEAAERWLAALDGQSVPDPSFSDFFAEALKTWAIDRGAAHFAYWIHPLGEEKRPLPYSCLADLSERASLHVLNGRHLVRRPVSTHFFRSERSGFVDWDPSICPFLWETEEGRILCIPAFFDAPEAALVDPKEVLLRSEAKLNRALIRLGRLIGASFESARSVLRVRQKYLLADHDFFWGAEGGATSKQSAALRSASVDERVSLYLRDLHEEVVGLGLPIQMCSLASTPHAYEAEFFLESSVQALSHQLLWMASLRKIGRRHHLVSLLAEESPETIDWSILTDSGSHLLDLQSHRWVGSLVFTALLRGIHEHGVLLRASVRFGSAKNDIDKKTSSGATLSELDSWTHHSPQVILHCGDGASWPLPAFESDRCFAVAAMNAAAADSLELLLDDLEGAISTHSLTPEALFTAARPILSNMLKEVPPVAHRPEQSGYLSGLQALRALVEKKTIRIFEGILNEAELSARSEALLRQYVNGWLCQANHMIEIFAEHRSRTGPKTVGEKCLEIPLHAVSQLQQLQLHMEGLGWDAKASVVSELIYPHVAQLKSWIASLKGI